jgi:hypothetical protein
MPFVVSATGEAGLPASQEEVEERRRERLAKKAAGGVAKKKTKKRVSATAGMTCDIQKLRSSVERQLIKFVQTPDAAVSAKWPSAPPGIHVVMPGAKGHPAYIFQIKDRLKSRGFEWDPQAKLWWRHVMECDDIKPAE